MVLHDSPWFAGSLLSILLFLPFSLTQMHRPHCSDDFSFANLSFTCSLVLGSKNRQAFTENTQNSVSISIILFTISPPHPSLKKDEMTDRDTAEQQRQECSEMASLASSSNLSGQPQTIYPSDILSCPGQEIQQQKTKTKTWTGTRRKSMPILTKTF